MTQAVSGALSGLKPCENERFTAQHLIGWPRGLIPTDEKFSVRGAKKCWRLNVPRSTQLVDGSSKCLGRRPAGLEPV